MIFSVLEWGTAGGLGEFFIKGGTIGKAAKGKNRFNGFIGFAEKLLGLAEPCIGQIGLRCFSGIGLEDSGKMSGSIAAKIGDLPYREFSVAVALHILKQGLVDRKADILGLGHFSENKA